MKKVNNEVNLMMDERQSKIIDKSIVIAFVFLNVCLFIATIVRIVRTENIGWEFLAILGSSAVILISRRVMGDIEQPLDYRNRPLPTGKSAKERLVRCQNYAVGSAVFGLTFAVMDVLLMLFGENEFTDIELTQIIFPTLGKTETVVVTAILTFVAMFLISFIFDYLIGEFYKVRLYNKTMAQLDEDENE